METDLKCNRLTCRTVLTDKAIVTNCSHIFCVDCANELFGTHKSVPHAILLYLNHDVVYALCILQTTIKPSFQAAILKNLNERNAHLQKQLDNVRISLLNNKLTSVERDLETERRKCRDLAESTREKDKEYQKLKSQYDVLKRKTILAPDTLATAAANEAAHQLAMNRTASPAEQQGAGGLRDIAGGMNANRVRYLFSSHPFPFPFLSPPRHAFTARKVQRTPLRQAQAQLSGGGLIPSLLAHSLLPRLALASLVARSSAQETEPFNQTARYPPRSLARTPITERGECISECGGAFAKARKF
ncbi:E3 ubiquitin-protein ligase CCNP1IP1 [Rhizoctonia solani]|uniref:E3 ubiquitin-protein ligase CCNP1IP1 n=1 Tax=Rhizoctonia solani TaxID=456999 RepID=A0A8H8SSY2_9AGAM|nr:E3 ubiquitin-protein ligase CCNP1IP1 [Rhizoctonia solani]QRW16499.1 E3 ubiquitin-protein ligase CCNP1IP1 [Rhizoctonia solani]